MSNLLQSLLVAVCLGITPAIKQIPTAVLWGYFIFMAVESLTGSQLWERCLLLLTDPRKRVAVLQQEHAAYLQVRLWLYGQPPAAGWCFLMQDCRSISLSGCPALLAAAPQDVVCCPR